MTILDLKLEFQNCYEQKKIFLHRVPFDFAKTSSHYFFMKSKEKIWVFVTNSYFLILISLQPNVLNLRYFKLWIQLDQIILTFKFAAQQSQFILSVKNERGRLNYSKYLLKLLVEFYQFRGIIISFHKTKKINLIKKYF